MTLVTNGNANILHINTYNGTFMVLKEEKKLFLDIRMCLLALVCLFFFSFHTKIICSKMDFVRNKIK